MNLDTNPFLRRGLASTTPSPLGLEVARTEGPWIITTDGRRVFDAISGIGVSNFGHQHPAILAQLRAQLDKHLHVMVYGECLQDAQTRAAASLLRTLPPSLDGVYFVNSGAEAVEAGLKLAKRATGRSRLMGVQGGYHGNTHGALSVSSNEWRKARYRPLLPEVDLLAWNDFQDLDRVDETVAAVILEPVQGDAGVRVPDPKWLRALRQVCSEHGTLLILDEIQCGMGRTGRPWAMDHVGLVPDAVCMGKALGGGVPIGALAASREHLALLAHSPTLGHITTFGGHPLACAGACGALEVMATLDWEALETRHATWEQALENHPAVNAVRRQGAFFAVELDSADSVAQAVHAGIKPGEENGVLLFWFLSVPHAFRLAPPLTLTDDEAHEGLRRILRTLDQLLT